MNIVQQAEKTLSEDNILNELDNLNKGTYDVSELKEILESYLILKYSDVCQDCYWDNKDTEIAFMMCDECKFSQAEMDNNYKDKHEIQ